MKLKQAIEQAGKGGKGKNWSTGNEFEITEDGRVNFNCHPTMNEIAGSCWEVVPKERIAVGDTVRDSKDCCRPVECKVIGKGVDDDGITIYAFQCIEDNTCICNVCEGATLIRKGGKPKSFGPVQILRNDYGETVIGYGGEDFIWSGRYKRMTLEPMEEAE